jgi:voltage-gated potassium channel
VPGTEQTSWVRVLVFVVVLAALVGLLAYSIRSIAGHSHPLLRGIEALTTLFALFVVAFSVAYLGMSHANAQSFSESLDHVGSLYFTVVVFSTVGFGDIAPKTDSARLVVMVQILLDFVFIGVAVRMIVVAIQRRVGRGHA